MRNGAFHIHYQRVQAILSIAANVSHNLWLTILRAGKLYAEARLCFRHTTAAKPVPNNINVVGSGTTVEIEEYRKLNVSD